MMKHILFYILLSTSIVSYGADTASLTINVKYLQTPDYGTGSKVVPEDISVDNIDTYLKQNYEYSKYGLEMKGLVENSQSISEKPEKYLTDELYLLKEKGVNHISLDVYAGLADSFTDGKMGQLRTQTEQVCILVPTIKDLPKVYPDLYERYQKIERFKGNKNVTDRLDRFFKKIITLKYKVMTDYDDYNELGSRVMGNKHICYNAIKDSDSVIFDTAIINAFQRISSWVEMKRDTVDHLLIELGY
jgi:hypothetical protein